jgi:hypothetical protein
MIVPLTKLERRRLARLQATVTKGHLADAERVQMMADYFGRGVTQIEIASILTEGSLDAGGRPIGVDAVHKSIHRHRLRNGSTNGQP